MTGRRRSLAAALLGGTGWDGPHPLRWCTGVCAVVTAFGVHAQAGSGLKYYVQPSIRLSQTISDNGGLDDINPKVEATTQVTPAVRISTRGQRIQGALDYAIDGVVYARETGDSGLQQRLRMSGRGELLEDRLYIDADAQMSRQAKSAFGQLPPVSGLSSANTVQTATYSLSPFLVGRIGSLADYRLRAVHSATIAPDASQYDATSQSVEFGVSSGVLFGRLGWAFDATHTVTAYEEGRRTRADGLVATLSYLVVPDLVVRVNGGTEWNDYRTVERTRYDRYGVGFEWRPTERTLISAQADDRYFGTGYNVVFQHRTPHTVWTLRAGRDVSEINGRGTGPNITVFDLLYAQFASIEPDPLLREQLVLNFLATNGISRDTLVSPNVLFGAATLQESQSLSFALVGRRTTITVTVSVARVSRLDTIATGIADDFADTSAVRQRGFNVNLSHRLTPQSSATLTLDGRHNEGDLAAQSTRQRTILLAWVTQLGVRSSLSLAGRHVSFDSQTDPYVENAVIATFSYRFN